MIDTIRLRLHGINSVKNDLKSEIARLNGFGDTFVLPEHNELYKKMLKFRGKHFSSKVMFNREIWTREDLSDEDFLILENSKKLNEHYQQRNMMRYTDEKVQKDVSLSVRGNYQVPSSYHGVTFSINENGGFIDFQLSIPKYLFGHSLAEFVPQIDCDFTHKNWAEIHTWKQQSKIIYERLIQFIDNWIVDICYRFELDQFLNKNFIEVTRIDICKNQYFETKEDSLQYLEHLKRINYKRYKNTARVKDTYNTGLSYTSSKGNYFKIYHKGTEYAESKDGDLKKHMEVNRQFIEEKKLDRKLGEVYTQNKEFMLHLFEQSGKGKSVVINPEFKEKIREKVEKLYSIIPFKVDFFKKEMDKVLRYEVSLKSDWLSYIYKTKVFRRKDEIHLIAVSKYKKTKSKYDYRNANRDQKISKKEKDNYDMIHEWLQRKTVLLLTKNKTLAFHEKSSSYDFSTSKDHYKISKYNVNYTLLAEKEVGTFSEDVLMFCIRYFYKTVMYYQVEQVNNFEGLLNRIDNYNRMAVDRVSEYDHANEHMIYDRNGNIKMKAGKVIKKASQLLTQKQLQSKGFKKLNAAMVMTVAERMSEGMSLREIRKRLGISPSAYCRLKKDLEVLKIYEQTKLQPVKIETSTDWRHYYAFTDSREVRKCFFIEKNHSYYG